jgi:hypothetical protein
VHIEQEEPEEKEEETVKEPAEEEEDSANVPYRLRPTSQIEANVPN